MYFLSVNWPGSVHDARVIRNSTLFNRFQEGFRPIPGACILADSAYPLTEWLIPPLLKNELTQQEQCFNNAHRRMCVTVECGIGILKNQFQCFQNLLVKTPAYAAKVIKCSIILHNMLLRARPVLNARAEVNRMMLNEQGLEEEADEEDGQNLQPRFDRRRQLIAQF